jgi:hypothetical protein
MLRASMSRTLLCLVLLCVAACGEADGQVTAAASMRYRNTAGKMSGAGDTGDAIPPSTDAGTTTHWFEPLKNAPAPLVTPTYDGSGQAVEPTVLLFPNGWQGHHYWMCVSPYPKGNASFENPSILVSEDGLSWSPPAGLQNPLVKPVQGELADATIVHDDASDELSMYYLDEVLDQGTHWQLLRHMSSKDGALWSPWTQLLEGHPFPLSSPSLVKVGKEFLMWTVDFGAAGCSSTSSHVLERSSTDGIHWTEPAVVGGITIPGYVVWHLNMTQVGQTGRLLAAVTAFREGMSCNSAELFLAYTEGANWVTVPQPVLSPGRTPAWDDHCIYRSSFLYDEGQSRLRAWYSARQTGTNAWHVGYTEGKLVLPP